MWKGWAVHWPGLVHLILWVQISQTSRKIKWVIPGSNSTPAVQNTKLLYGYVVMCIHKIITYHIIRHTYYPFTYSISRCNYPIYIYIAIYLLIYLSMYPPIYLSIYLSIDKDIRHHGVATMAQRATHPVGSRAMVFSHFRFSGDLNKTGTGPSSCSVSCVYNMYIYMIM